MEIFWARLLPNNMLVVHGRQLMLNRQAASPTGMLNGGVKLTQILDNTSDGTPALEEVQLYDMTGKSGTTVTITREDGLTASANIQKVTYDPVESVLPVPSAGTAKYVIGKGTYKNITIEMPRTITRPSQYAAIEINQTGPLYMENVTIINRAKDGIGIVLNTCYDAHFENVKIVADEPIYSPPNGKHARNNFLWCDWSANARQYGQLNRGVMGQENFLAWTKWHDMDRGPVSQQSGPPMYRNLLYRCEQHLTGTTIGGSEGVLWEAPNGYPLTGQVTNNKLVFTIDKTVISVDVRAGLFACDLNAKKWARINSFQSTTNGNMVTYTLTLDRDMGTTATFWFVGNCIVENTVVNSTFTSGKLGVHLFGRSMGNVFKLWDCRDIHDVVVEETKENTPENPNASPRNVFGWAWGNVYDRLRTMNCNRGIYKCYHYYDGKLPPEQLPWLKYADKNIVVQ